MISGVSMTSRSGSNPVCRMRIPAKKADDNQADGVWKAQLFQEDGCNHGNRKEADDQDNAHSQRIMHGIS
jgi:hypothetical protein